MSEVLLRPAKATDAAALAAIHRAARRAAMPYLPELHGDAEDRDWMRGTVLRRATVWVALVDGRPVGYSALTGGRLDQLYVVPGFQGRGIGSQLLKKAKALSPVGLRLHVFQRNRRAKPADSSPRPSPTAPTTRSGSRTSRTNGPDGPGDRPEPGVAVA